MIKLHWIAVALLGAAACSSTTDSKSEDTSGTGTGGINGNGGALAPAPGTGGVTSSAGSGGHAAGPPASGGTGGAPAQPPIDASIAQHDAGLSDAAADGGPPSADACDRACLLAVMKSYLDALVAHDPTKAKFKTGAKYTANGVVAMLGDGLWKTATKLDPDEHIEFADPEFGQVASQLVVDEGAAQVIYQVRLKVVAHEITEIEAMEVRQADAANGFFSPADMKPQPVFNQAIDPAKRMTREQLKAEVDLYVMYLDGKVGGDGVHFDANCARYENGFSTASGLTSFQLQSWTFDVVDRYLVFDEEAGLVWGMFPFTHDPETLVVGELFKVIDGKIMMIQAVMANMPAKAWD
jgi:hypothetical protein